VGAVLRSVATVAALGALHSRAGATTLTSNVASPLQATVGTPITTVAFGLQGTQTNPSSWQINGSLPPGLNINDRTSLGLFITPNPVLSGTPTKAGSYTLTLSGSDQGFVSPSFDYTINVASAGGGSTAPAISTQPVGQTVTSGANVTFTVAASGTPSPTFQWQLNGVAISGATGTTLTLTGVTTANAGTYTVVVTNSAGSVKSSAAVLTVNAVIGTAPTIITQPVGQYVGAGLTATFTVAATASGQLSYQWNKNGSPIAGANGAAFTLSSVQAADMGFYTATVSSSGGSVTSNVAVLTVNTGGSSRLVNVSTRGLVQAGGVLTPGFILGGAGSKNVLVRADGPTLASFSVPEVLSDPKLDLIPLGSSTIILSNDNWGTGPNSNASVISSTSQAVGAFPLPAGSLDSSVLTSLAAGGQGYTVRITPSGAAVSGIALAEVYDADPLSTPSYLYNVSTLGYCGTGAEVLTPGFIIGGNAPKQLLIRASGPTIASPPYNVQGTMADPQISVVPLGQSATIASNDNWGDNGQTSTLQAVFNSAGAFPFVTGSKDAALVVRLPPGAYTVVVSGVNGGTGVVLVEVYDLDPTH
jgi:hypothetical protein